MSIHQEFWLSVLTCMRVPLPVCLCSTGKATIASHGPQLSNCGECNRWFSTHTVHFVLLSASELVAVCVFEKVNRHYDECCTIHPSFALCASKLRAMGAPAVCAHVRMCIHQEFWLSVLTCMRVPLPVCACSAGPPISDFSAKGELNRAKVKASQARKKAGTQGPNGGARKGAGRPKKK